MFVLGRHLVRMSTLPTATKNEVSCCLPQYLQANIVIVDHYALTDSLKILSSSPFTNDPIIGRYAL